MTDSKTVDLNSPNSPTPDGTQEVKTQLLDQLKAAQPSSRADVTEVFDRVNSAKSLLDQVDREEESTAGDTTLSADPSIEEYMAALLARSNGFSNESSPPTSTQVLPSQEQPAVKEEPEKPSRPAVEVPPEKRVQKPAPECRDDLSNMRKLANLNARSALDTHSGRRLIFEMHNKLIVSMVAIMLSFGLVTVASSVRSLAYIGAILALITATVWSLRYLTLARQLDEICDERSPQLPPRISDDGETPSPA